MQPASTSHTLTVVASRRGQSARLVTSARRRRLEGQAQAARDSKLRRHHKTSHSLDMIANEWEGTALPETRGIAAMTTAAAKVPRNLTRFREPGATCLLITGEK